MKPETKFRTSTVDKDLDALILPGAGWETSVQQVAIKGTPDKIGCIRAHCACGRSYGQFFALELKADAKAPIEELQIYNIERIKQAGGIGRIVHPGNWKQVLEELKLCAFAI